MNKNHTMLQIHKIVVKANKVFSNWPNSFVDFIEEFRQIPKAKSITGIKNEFGNFYTQFYKRFGEIDYNEIRCGFEEYLLKYWDGGQITSKVKERFIIKNTPSYISGEEARLILNLQYEALLELIEVGKIKGIITKRSKNKQILVHRESIESYLRLKRSEPKYLSLNEASNLLGISKRFTRLLIHSSVIKALSGPTIDGKKDWKVDESSIDLLVLEFETMMTKRNKTTSVQGKTISFLELVKYYRGVDFVNLISYVKEGRVTPVYRPKKGEGILDYHFFISDVPRIEDSSNKSLLYIRDVAKRFGSNYKTVVNWMESRLLDIKKVDGCPCFDPVEISKFEETYMTLNQIRDYFDQKHPSIILKYLLTRGVFPILESEDPKDYSAAYEDRLSLLFKKEKVIEVLFKDIEPTYYLVSQLPKLLDISLGAIYSWIKKGWIQSRMKCGIQMIHINDINLFKQEYIWLREVYLMTRLRESYLYKKLTEQGVLALYIDQEDDGKPFLFNRRECLKLIDNLTSLNEKENRNQLRIKVS